MPVSRWPRVSGAYGGKLGRMYSSWSPGAAPARRGPAAEEKATQKPMTSMPATAAQVRTDSQVPRATSAQAAGSTRATTRARRCPLPGIRESPASATAAKSA